MTLAEIFLLMLFVIWLGYSNEIDEQRDYAALKERVIKLEKQNEELQKLNRKANKKIADLEKRIEYLRKQWKDLTGFDSPPTKDILLKWAKEVANRGKPKCQEENVLIKAEVLNGRKTITVVGDCPELIAWLSEHKRYKPKKGVRITDSSQVKNFVQSILLFYAYKKQRNDDCRFDYVLYWQTDNDYRNGRQYFEQYFYPAGIKRRN